MIGARAEDSDLQPMILIPTSITINNDAAVVVVDETHSEFFQQSEGFGFQGNVVFAEPIYISFSHSVLDQTAVMGFTTSLQPRRGAQSAVAGNIGLPGKRIGWRFLQQGNFVKLWHTWVVRQLSIVDPKRFDILGVDVTLGGKPSEESSDHHQLPGNAEMIYK